MVYIWNLLKLKYLSYMINVVIKFVLIRVEIIFDKQGLSYQLYLIRHHTTRFVFNGNVKIRGFFGVNTRHEPSFREFCCRRRICFTPDKYWHECGKSLIMIIVWMCVVLPLVHTSKCRPTSKRNFGNTKRKLYNLPPFHNI